MARTTPAAIRRRRTGGLLQQLDFGDAAVPVPEDELDEPLARREPARPRAAPERIAALLHRRLDRERLEGPSRHADRLQAEHLRVARHAEDLEVAAARRGPPRVAGDRIGGEDRVEAEAHQIERRDEVAAL